MAEVVNPLLGFSSQRPAWLQDLIRRVYIQAELSEADLSAVRGFLLAEHSAESIMPSRGLCRPGVSNRPLREWVAPVRSA